MTQDVLTCSELYLKYGDTPALHGVSLRIGMGEVVAVTGRSGSGKSSLLYCLAGLARPQRGDVMFEGRRLVTLGDEALSQLRLRAFGFVFQFGELVPELSLRENVGLPLRLLGMTAADARTRTERLLETLGIDGVAHRRAAQVSGGQAQRAALARALVHDPRVVFADEPTGSLDRDNGHIVLRELLSLARVRGTAVVLVTHDDDVAAVADRQVSLVDGMIGAEAPVPGP